MTWHFLSQDPVPFPVYTSENSHSFTRTPWSFLNTIRKRELYLGKALLVMEIYLNHNFHPLEPGLDHIFSGDIGIHSYP